MGKTAYLKPSDSTSDMDFMEYVVLGLMSGTSLDGLDICCVRFQHSEKGWNFSILDAETTPLPPDLQRGIQAFDQLSESQLKDLSHEMGVFSGEAVNQFLSTHNLPKVKLIGAHGHTVFHQPDKSRTVQIGNGPEIRDLTGITTICDFRVADVALGGQGAPLVPIGDRLLFSDMPACLNLGGFANVSFEEEGQRIAYDLCPVNFVLNEWANKLNVPYDEDGNISRSGEIILPLLNELNDLSYYSETPPKSLGREWIEQNVNPVLEKYALDSTKETDSNNVANIMATFTEHAAEIISGELAKIGGPVLVTGGGAYNQYLIEKIRTKSAVSLLIPQPQLIEYKEALIFAFLAVLKYREEINVLASVTGAKKDHSSGVIWPAK
ncbi:MAG: anhydro-N-acetylmuramic acid kinase [Schleiferiaceae bacterium]